MPEFVNPLNHQEVEQARQEQEAQLEQGQRLAEQIQDMREKAQTKEDYIALQEKLAELRKIFGAEKEQGEKVYRSLYEAIKPLVEDLGKNNIDQLNNWRWTSWLTGGSRFVEMGRIDGYEDGLIFDDNPPKAIINRFNNNVDKLDGGIGFDDLKDKIGDRKVRSYLVNGVWLLELEPDREGEGRDLKEVMEPIAQVYNTMLPDDDFMSSIGYEVHNYNSVRIKLKTNITRDETDVKFDAPPTGKELDHFIGNPTTLQVSSGNGVDGLNTFINHRKVKVYDIDDEMWLEIISPEFESKGLRDLVKETLEERSSVPLEFTQLHWKISDTNKSIINTGLLVSKAHFMKSKVMQEPSIEDWEEIKGLTFGADFGEGFDSLAAKVGGPNVKAKSLACDGVWYIKLD